MVIFGGMVDSEYLSVGITILDSLNYMISRLYVLSLTCLNVEKRTLVLLSIEDPEKGSVSLGSDTFGLLNPVTGHVSDGSSSTSLPKILRD